MRLAHIEQVVARLDGRHRADLRVLKELVGGFVYLFLLYFPSLPEQTRDAAHTQATKRMADFVAFAEASRKAGKSVDQAAAEYRVPARYQGFVASLMLVASPAANLKLAYDELSRR